MADTIITSKCDKECIFGSIDNSNPSKIVYCKIKNKRYMYGQKIPCDQKIKKKEQ